VWNRAHYEICPLRGADLIQKDSDLADLLERATPDLLLVLGPWPTDLECVDTPRTTVSAFDEHPLAADVVVLRGDFDAAMKHVCSVEGLSSPPRMSQRIMEALRDENMDTQRLSHIIAATPELTATILREANSPLLGLSRQVKDVASAVVTLGYRRVAEIALSSCIIGMFAHSDVTQRMWRHRLLVAAVTARLARQLRYPPLFNQQIYVAGVLHDVGRSVLHQTSPELYGTIYATEVSETTAYRWWVDELGFHPGDVGAALARQWNLPDEVEATARYHHAPAALDLGIIDGAYLISTWLVMAAKVVADGLQHGMERERVVSGLRPLCETPSVPPRCSEALGPLVEADYQQLRDTLGRRED